MLANYSLDTTDRSKISSDQKRLFFAASLNPLSFFANTPFKGICPIMQTITYIFIVWARNFCGVGSRWSKYWKLYIRIEKNLWDTDDPDHLIWISTRALLILGALLNFFISTLIKAPNSTLDKELFFRSTSDSKRARNTDCEVEIPSFNADQAHFP